MKDIARIDLMIEQLRLAWHQNPDFCLEHLVDMIATQYDLGENFGAYLDDDEMLKAIIQFTQRTKP